MASHSEPEPTGRHPSSVRRSASIWALAAKSRLTGAEIDVLRGELGLSRSSVYRMLAAFRSRPKESTLQWKTRGRKIGSRVILPETELIIERAIESFYLQRLKPSFSALVRQVQIDCHKAGLKPPNKKTIHRRVDALDQQAVVAAREGAKVAREKFGRVAHKTPVLKALAEVQIDHTPVDLIVVDERTRNPMGRPWLTLAIDVASRMICGFYLSMRAPSTVSVALAMSHCVAKKDLWLADRELSFDWPASGLPDVVQMDNAKEFHTKSLTMTAIEYGIELRYRPPGSPHFGGHIERLIGTMMGAVHLLPGTTFSNVKDRGSYPSESEAVLTLAKLERWLALQIHQYHSSLHSMLKMTPMAAWQQALSRRDAPVRNLIDHRSFFLDLLPGERRKIRRDGIRLFNVHYWDNLLSPLAARLNGPVLVKYDPRDISIIYYKDNEGAYWPIPYRDLGAPAISLWEQQAAEAQLRSEGKQSFTQEEIFSAALQQREIISAASREKRQVIQTKTRLAELPAKASVVSPPDTSELDHISIAPYKVEEWN